MKVVVLGKGGCGKSTVSSILAKNLSDRGYRVLVIDTDESNYGLHKQLGLGEPEELMDHLGGKKEMGRKLMESMRNGSSDEPMAQMLGDKWSLDDIPPECLCTKDGISLMQIGKVKHFGEGCACPMGALARSFLENLVLNDKEVAIVDTEAGVEHIGRGVEKSSDLILMILDPSYESLRLSRKVKEMLDEIDKSVYFVINKSDKDSATFLREKLDPSKLVVSFGNDPGLLSSGLMGEEVPHVVDGALQLTDFVINRMS